MSAQSFKNLFLACALLGASAHAAYPDGGLAAGEDHARRLDRLAVQLHLAGDAGMHLGHVARLALQIAENQHRETGRFRFGCGGGERQLRRCDPLEVAAGE